MKGRLLASGNLYVLYGQLVVHEPGLERAFNDWNRRQYEQGFTWSERSVGFSMLSDSGTCDVAIYSGVSQPSWAPTNIIRVPFLVPPSGVVTVASVSAEFTVEVGAGFHALTCFHRLREDTLVVQLNFTPSARQDIRAVSVLGERRLEGDDILL